MWKNKSVSVILPTHTEKDNIRRSIEEFLETGFVDEVLVVNNLAEPGTDEEIRRTSATLIYENRPGYGYAIQAGLARAKGDILVISEPDGTFMGKDLIKLLSYEDDFEVVFGTRTSKELIWQGANMGFFLRWGNYAVAKLMEFLFNTSQISDMGCTMKLIRRGAYERIKGEFAVTDSRFNAEFMLWVIIKKIRFIEIPVNYNRRLGRSTITGTTPKAAFLGMRMVFLICAYFLMMLSGGIRRQ
jgi:glycosyltransferase involved in cell wall biosynthesis